MRSSSTPSGAPGRPRIGVLIRAGAVVAVLASGFVLGAPPAAASTASVELTLAFNDLYDSGGSYINTAEVASGIDCSPPSGSLTLSGTGSSGTVSTTVARDYAVTLLGWSHHRIALTMTLTGTYSSGVVSLTGSWSATLRRTAGAGSCTVTGGGQCNVTNSNLALTGGLYAAAPPTLAEGDALELAGSNPLGSASVTGTFTQCSYFILHNGGYVEMGDVRIEVPVSSTSHGAAVTGGSLGLQGPGGWFDVLALGGGLGSCSAPTATVTAGGNSYTGTASVAMTSDRPYRSPGGTDFRVVTSTSLSGTTLWSWATLTGTSTATLTRTTGGFGSCATTGGSCTVTSTGLTLQGPTSTWNPALFGTGATLTLDGGNGAPDTDVTGSGTDCADVVAIDNGQITFWGLTLTGT
jgi:hypothetical protein